MAKLNLKNISIAYLGASVASVSSGIVGSYLWSEIGDVEVHYGLVTATSWMLACGIPSTLVSMETLRRSLGERQQNSVKAIGGHQGRRAIPFNANGKTSHVFLSSIPFLKPQNTLPEGEEVSLPTIFTATIDDNDYSVTIDELESFIRTAWRKQRIGEAGLSRPYWTRRHQPRLKPLEYYARLNVLLSCNGLILDRSKRRSGRLAVSPQLTIKALQGQFSLV